jgi:hypothetical protein
MLLQFTPQPPQYAFVVRSRQWPLQQRFHRVPHEVPSATLREQLRFSPKFWLAHVPDEQWCSVRVRDCDALSSHASA